MSFLKVSSRTSRRKRERECVSSSPFWTHTIELLTTVSLKREKKKSSALFGVEKKGTTNVGLFFYASHQRRSISKTLVRLYIYIYNQHTIDHDDHVCDHHHRTQRRSKRNARAEQRRQRDGEEKNNRHRRLEDVFVVFDV